MRTIQKDLYRRNQSWNCVQVTAHAGGHRLRVTIRVNAYADQSYARCERWDGNEWREVIALPVDALRCSSVSYVAKNVDEAPFDADADDLRAMALAVVA